MQVYWSEVGVGVWHLLDPVHYVNTGVDGNPLIKPTAFAAHGGGGPIPATVNLKIIATVFDRTHRTSARQFLSYVKALGCLDETTFRFGLHPLAVNVGATSRMDALWETWVGGFPQGVLTLGTANWNLYDGPASFYPDPYRQYTHYDAGQPDYKCAPNEWSWGPYISPPLYVFEIGCQSARANISMEIKPIGDFPKILTRLPAGVEIIRGLTEVTLPAGAEVTTRHYVQYRHRGFSWPPGGPINVYGDETDSGDVVTDAMPGGLGLMGWNHKLGPDGAWQALGAFVDGAAELKAGYSRVIESTSLMKAFVEGSAPLKSGVYSRFAIYPTPSANPFVSADGGLEISGNSLTSFLDMVWGGYSNYKCTEATGGDMREEDTRHWMTMPAQVDYGFSAVKFKLPNGLMAELRIIPGGFYPPLVDAP